MPGQMDKGEYDGGETVQERPSRQRWHCSLTFRAMTGEANTFEGTTTFHLWRFFNRRRLCKQIGARARAPARCRGSWTLTKSPRTKSTATKCAIEAHKNRSQVLHTSPILLLRTSPRPRSSCRSYHLAGWLTDDDTWNIPRPFDFSLERVLPHIYIYIYELLIVIKKTTSHFFQF